MGAVIDLGAAVLRAGGPARQAEALKLVCEIHDVNSLAKLIPSTGEDGLELLLALAWMNAEIVGVLAELQNIEADAVLDAIAIGRRAPLHVVGS